jgi:hypothetical protein
VKQSQTTAAVQTATNISREFELLCACAGVELSPDRIARIENWNSAAIDWDEFLRMAEHHGVLPLAARNLSAHAHALPIPVEQALRAAFDANVRRNLWFASELARIDSALAQKQLRAIPYKGPTLSESAYGDVALRHFSDLDFLIAPSDFLRAKAALAELGYHPSKDLSPAVERYWLRNGYECSFDSAAGKYLVELQWAIVPGFYSVDLRIEDLLARSRPAALGGRELRALSPEDLVLVLCLHAAKHLWMRLIWVCDIAETIRTHSLDWDVLRRRAERLGCLRIIGLGFWLAETLLGAVLPAPALSIMNSDAHVPALGNEFAGRLCRGATYDFESTEYFRTIANLRERRRDRFLYWWRLLSLPGESDLAAMKLPEAMFPLYRAVRVVRLLRKLF